MTTLLLKAAYIQSDVKAIINTAQEVLELMDYASEVWNENTIELSESCIKTTHKAYELLVCFIRFILNDGSVSKASNEVMNAMEQTDTYDTVRSLQTFALGFINEFVSNIGLVVLELPKTLAELKIIAKSLGVKSYASFRSVVNIQAAIDKAI